MRIRNTVPEVIESLPCFTVGDLKAHGFFNKAESYREMPITIRSKDQIAASLQLAVNTEKGNCYIKLEYHLNHEHLDYRIPLVQVQNNLGSRFSSHWYFLCPLVNKRCRKLYLGEKYFSHVRGIENGFYMQQTLSRSSRPAYQLMKRLNKATKVLEIQNQKKFTRSYAGVKTKKQHQVDKGINQLNEIVNSTAWQ